jgi:hypothetical protein
VFVSEGTFTMAGGAISNNTASYAGGGVYVSDQGTFIKRGSAAIDATNRAELGNAVCIDTSPLKARDTAAGPEVDLDSRVSGRAGGWE